MTDEQLQTLKTELDKAAYANLGDEAAANALNEPDKSVDRESIDAGLLMSCIVRTEYDALDAKDKDYLRVFIAACPVPLTQEVKQGLGGVFGAGTTTRTNVVSALKRTGSRAEALGLGRVTPSAVAKARRI